MTKIILLSLIVLGFMSCNKKDEVRTSIIGSWNCEEYSDVYGQRIYQTNIVRNPISDATNQYVINNFHNTGLGEEVEVYVTEVEPGKLTITGSANIRVKYVGGAIVVDDFSKINWTYKVNDGANNPNVTSTYY